MKSRLQVVSAPILMQYMSERGTTCGGDRRGPISDCIEMQHSRPILPPEPAEFEGWGRCSNNINSKMSLAEIHGVNIMYTKGQMDTACVRGYLSYEMDHGDMSRGKKEI